MSSSSSYTVLITGAAGFIGKKLTARLIADSSSSDDGKKEDGKKEDGKKDEGTGTITLRGDDTAAIGTLVLTDVIEPESPPTAPFEVKTIKADLSEKDDVDSIISGHKPDVVFHLAAIVSGDAEKNFERGYGINVDGTKCLLEAIREVNNAAAAKKEEGKKEEDGDEKKKEGEKKEGDGGGGGTDAEYKPRFVFVSSAAVFGGSVPTPIPDSYHLTPKTSYGTQKAICELLVDDYTRKGYLDGVSIRFPTISVRPGKPNKAASSFISGIIREPLSGVEAVCPVGREVKHPVASPRKAVEYLVKAAGLTSDRIGEVCGGAGRALIMPAITVSVGDMVDALEKVAGKEVSDLVKMEKDDFVHGIISNWQFEFEASRARELGFEPDGCFEDVVKAHIDDELGGAVHVAKKARTE